MKRLLMLSCSVLALTGAAHAADIALMPHVPDNATLSATKSTAYDYLVRDDFSVGFGAPPLTYKKSNSACSLNAGAGDGGSQVPSADGKCWLAVVPASGADIREWGASTLVSDNTAAINAAIAWGCSVGGKVTIPIGIFNIASTIATPTSACVKLTLAGDNFWGSYFNFTGAGTQDAMQFGAFSSNTGIWEYGIKVVDLHLNAQSRTGGACLNINGVSRFIADNVWMDTCYNGIRVVNEDSVTVVHGGLQAVNGLFCLKWDQDPAAPTNTNLLELYGGWYCQEQYAARGQITGLSATTAIGSPTLTSLSGDPWAKDVIPGMHITGSGIPANTVINAMTATSLTMNQNATGNGSTALTISGKDSIVWDGYATTLRATNIALLGTTDYALHVLNSRQNAAGKVPQFGFLTAVEIDGAGLGAVRIEGGRDFHISNSYFADDFVAGGGAGTQGGLDGACFSVLADAGFSYTGEFTINGLRLGGCGQSGAVIDATNVYINGLNIDGVSKVSSGAYPALEIGPHAFDILGSAIQLGVDYGDTLTVATGVLIDSGSWHTDLREVSCTAVSANCVVDNSVGNAFVDGWGLNAAAATMTVTACGTGTPTVSGSPFIGRITTGGGNPTSCTLNFNANALASPISSCTVSGVTGTIGMGISGVGVNQLIINMSAAYNAALIYYTCH